MKGLLRRRPSPALVIACIALFVALGPAAYATHEVINSSDVVDNSLQGIDVRGTAGSSTTAAVNGSLTGADISGQPANAAVGQPFVNGSLTGFDVADGSLQNADIATNAINGVKVAANSLSGADINESSLGIVPNSDKLDGMDSTGFVRGNGNVYRGRLQLMHDPEDAQDAVGDVLTVPGFGDVQGQCSHRFDFAGVSRVSFLNDSGGDLDAWWFQKGGVGFHRLDMSSNRGADLTGLTPDSHVVVLQLSRAGRTATIIATQRVTSVGDDDAECTYSAQAVAQIN